MLADGEVHQHFLGVQHVLLLGLEMLEDGQCECRGHSRVPGGRGVNLVAAAQVVVVTGSATDANGGIHGDEGQLHALGNPVLNNAWHKFVERLVPSDTKQGTTTAVQLDSSHAENKTAVRQRRHATCAYNDGSTQATQRRHATCSYNDAVVPRVAC